MTAPGNAVSHPGAQLGGQRRGDATAEPHRASAGTLHWWRAVRSRTIEECPAATRRSARSAEWPEQGWC
jgi:hypothetical protein